MRSYSRNSGSISWEIESGLPRSPNAAATRASFFAIREREEQRDRDRLRAGCAVPPRARALIPLLTGSSSVRPSASILSSTPKRISRSTSGGIRSKKKSYRRGRACRPISITSSNPAVVTRATRAPFRSSSAFVPTVVPCSSVMPTRAPILPSASAIAREGSSGVENTFRVLSSPCSTQTQSVNVPPVSMAMRSVGLAKAGINREDYHGRASGTGDRRGRQCRKHNHFCARAVPYSESCPSGAFVGSGLRRSRQSSNSWLNVAKGTVNGKAWRSWLVPGGVVLAVAVALVNRLAVRAGRVVALLLLCRPFLPLDCFWPGGSTPAGSCFRC